MWDSKGRVQVSLAKFNAQGNSSRSLHRQLGQRELAGGLHQPDRPEPVRRQSQRDRSLLHLCASRTAARSARADQLRKPERRCRQTLHRPLTQARIRQRQRHRTQRHVPQNEPPEPAVPDQKADRVSESGCVCGEI